MTSPQDFTPGQRVKVDASKDPAIEDALNGTHGTVSVNTGAYSAWVGVDFPRWGFRWVLPQALSPAPRVNTETVAAATSTPSSQGSWNDPEYVTWTEPNHDYARVYLAYWKAGFEVHKATSLVFDAEQRMGLSADKIVVEDELYKALLEAGRLIKLRRQALKDLL